MAFYIVIYAAIVHRRVCFAGHCFHARSYLTCYIGDYDALIEDLDHSTTYT